MFRCCKERKKFKFDYGSVVVAYDEEEALDELKKMLKKDDEDSWSAYLDYRNLKIKIAEDKK
jgi:hypothetical protein